MNTKNRIWFYGFIVIGLGLIFANSCTKERNQVQPPVLTTANVSSITPSTANSGGNITSDGGATITSRGVCWSTAQNPTTADTKTTDGSGPGTFTSSITGLTATTTYYVKAYASNSEATSYGDEFLFKTFTGIVSDADGNVYNTITIGTQIWMAGNLRTTKYSNGDLIGTTTLDISGESTPKYQWAYDGNESNSFIYGRLYTWYAVTDARNICPTGWHIPTETEWTTLTTFLGGVSVAGGKLKEKGTAHWSTPNEGATNETGFTALPTGYRNEDGRFVDIGYPGGWWSSTERSAVNAWGLYVYYNSNYVLTGSYSKGDGYGARCLKN